METPKTKVIGYFNPNDYPLNVQISAINGSIRLDPDQWIVNKVGVVNDPMLDRYVKKGSLSRALGKADVEINYLVAPSSTPRPAVQGNPVRQATAFKNQGGHMVAVMAPLPEANPNFVAPQLSKPAITSMSMAEARRLKFVKPVREVPEDYGATDGSGSPVSAPPDMIYAKDAPIPNSQRRPSVVVARPETQAVIEAHRVAGIDPEDPNILRKAFEAAKAEVEQAGATVAVAPPKSVALPVKKSAPPIPQVLVPTEIVEDAIVAEDDVVVEEELVDTTPSIPVLPDTEDPVITPDPVAPAPVEDLVAPKKATVKKKGK